MLYEWRVPYQSEPGDGEYALQAAEDEEGAEEAEPVVSQVFEWQLEDVPPANAAQVYLLRGPVGGTTQHKELHRKTPHVFNSI